MTRVLTLWKHGVKTGLLSGLMTVLLSLMGMVEAFSQRQIVSGILSMDQSLLGAAVVFMGYLCREKDHLHPSPVGSDQLAHLRFRHCGELMLLLVIGDTDQSAGCFCQRLTPSSINCSASDRL